MPKNKLKAGVMEHEDFKKNLNSPGNKGIHNPKQMHVPDFRNNEVYGRAIN